MSLQDGWTPLHCASRCGNVDIVEMLITAGSIINAANKVRIPVNCNALIPFYTLPCTEQVYHTLEQVARSQTFHLFDFYFTKINYQYDGWWWWWESE